MGDCLGGAQVVVVAAHRVRVHVRFVEAVEESVSRLTALWMTLPLMMMMIIFSRSILSDPLRRNSHVAPLERHCSSVSFNSVQLHR